MKRAPHIGPAATVGLAMLLIGLPSCAPRAAPPSASPGASSAGQAKYRTELLQSAMSLLNSPERFDDEEQASAQIVERLNQWTRMSREASPAASTDSTWKPDPLIDGLSEVYRRGRWFRGLDRDVFELSYDGPFLREAALVRDVAHHVSAGQRDSLAIAEALFDWTVRNIQAEAQPPDDAPPAEQWMGQHLPLETLFFGRGTPMQRAWVFILLARQAGLDAVVLGTPDPRNPDQPRPWVVAVLADSELYLFDPTYGLPIPGPGGKGIATLAQAAADDAVLRQMDIPGDRIYPRKAADLQKVKALIEGSPGYLTRRMNLLESQLTGRDRIVLSTAPSALAEQLSSLKQIGDVKLWDLPYKTLAARTPMAPPMQQVAATERLPFAIPANPETTSPKQDERRKPRPMLPLRIGRLLHLRGEFGGDAERPAGGAEELSEVVERGAKFYYLRAIPTQQQLDDIVRLEREGTEIIPGRRLTKPFVAATERMRDDAVYWMGLVSAEQGAWQTAVQYFGPMTLEADPNGPWANGARYNLARAYEALGRNAEAIELYKADRSPQRYGNRLRAERLGKKDS